MLTNEFANVVRNFSEGFENAAIDYLFASRSQVNNGNITQGVFDPVDFVYAIDETTNGQRAVQITQTIMEENNLMGSQIIFCDSTAYDKFRFQAAQGTGNSTNLSFQFDNATFIRSIGLDNATRFGSLAATYNKGVWVSAPVGDFALLDWTPKQNRMGVETKEQKYAMLSNPIDKLNYALHTYEERSNQIGDNGQTQDELQQFEVSIDISFEKAPVETGVIGETVFQAFALV